MSWRLRALRRSRQRYQSLKKDGWDENVRRWRRLLDAGPRDLFAYELGDVLPPRGNRGTMNDTVRRARVRMLKQRGYTCEGQHVEY